MENDDKTFEAYFSGKMNSSQANDFTTALQNNDTLKKDYDYFVAVKKGANLIERDNMRGALENVEIMEENIDLKTPRKSNAPIISIVKWVASVAAMLLISFFAYQTFQPTSVQELYAQNFETYKVQAERGGNIDALNEVYASGDYDLFIVQALKAEESPETNMMLANAYLNAYQYDKAIEKLTKISDDSSLRDQKYWYLGLANLKLNNVEEASNHFHKLLSISNYKKVETEEILSEIVKK